MVTRSWERAQVLTIRAEDWEPQVSEASQASQVGEEPSGFGVVGAVSALVQRDRRAALLHEGLKSRQLPCAGRNAGGRGPEVLCHLLGGA